PSRERRPQLAARPPGRARAGRRRRERHHRARADARTVGHAGRALRGGHVGAGAQAGGARRLPGVPPADRRFRDEAPRLRGAGRVAAAGCCRRARRLDLPPHLPLPAAGPLSAASVAPQADRDALLAAAQRLRAEVGKRIVGQHEVLDEILMALVAGGHALLVGVPGLAKTLMIRSVAEAMSLDFRRIQFTPDLVPSDITGTELLEE